MKKWALPKSVLKKHLFKLNRLHLRHTKRLDILNPTKKVVPKKGTIFFFTWWVWATRL